MLERNLIYTANTRARELAIFLAHKRAIHMAVKTQSVMKRNSLLAQRIRIQVPIKPESVLKQQEAATNA